MADRFTRCTCHARSVRAMPVKGTTPRLTRGCVFYARYAQTEAAANVLKSTKHKPLHRSSKRLRKFRSAASVRSSSFRSSFRRRSVAAVCFCTFCGVFAASSVCASVLTKKARCQFRDSAPSLFLIIRLDSSSSFKRQIEYKARLFSSLSVVFSAKRTNPISKIMP